MIITLRIPDELYDQFQEKSGGKAETFITENVDTLLSVNKGDNQITLTGKDIGRISAALGGRLFKSPTDIVHALEASLRMSVDGFSLQLDQEDATALRERFESTGYKDYGKYIEDSIKEALCMYLWGSTRGVLSW